MNGEPRPGILERIARYVHVLVNLLRAAWIEYERDRARYLAVAMIYYAMLSLAPLLLLALAALGLLLRFSATAKAVQQQILLKIEASFGPDLLVEIQQILNTMEQQSIIATITSLAGLLVAASVLFHNLRLSFRAIWKIDPPLISGPVRVVVRTTLSERVIAFVMLLGGGVLLLAALVLIATTQWLDRLPQLGQTARWLFPALSSFVLAVITFALLFKFLPPVPLRWRYIRLATLLCAVAWVIASEFLAISGAFLARNRSAYSAVGGVLAIMLWMNIVGKVLFFGAELCKVVAMQEGDQPQVQPPAV